ncbi:cytochrome C oxidase Cbb3, partial [Caulobacter sp. 602-1]
RGQIFAGNGGVMPTWAGRLSPETIKAIAVYVHANAAGQ